MCQMVYLGVNRRILYSTNRGPWTLDSYVCPGEPQKKLAPREPPDSVLFLNCASRSRTLRLCSLLRRFCAFFSLRAWTTSGSLLNILLSQYISEAEVDPSQ